MELEELQEKKRMIYAMISDEDYRPMKIKEMAVFLNVPKSQRGDFHEVVDSLLQEGKIAIGEKGRLTLPSEDVRTGKFMGTRRGFGFVRVEGEDDDIFIPENYCKDAFDGDTVLLQLWHHGRHQRRGRREGEIIRVVSRGTDCVVGTFEKSGQFGFVVVDNEKFSKDVYIPKHKTLGAVDGHKVVVRLTDFGGKEKSPEGEVIEILGHINDPGVDILSVIRSFSLAEAFPEEVMAEAGRMPEEIDTKETAGRVDLRGLKTVTIDGADAKDLDDAITLEKDENGYHLGVHIADVSHYVKEGSPLDQEALNRATSVYLVDRVIPMIPHKLSNGICSLNAGTDRLALSCLMDFDFKGNLTGHKIAETVIQVDERMNYSDVNELVTNHPAALSERYAGFVEMFEQMEELAAILRKNRKKKGSIDFDFPECKIELDKEGRPIDIHPYERNVATRIIEEFMLAANQVVAEDYFWLELPFVYRTHEYPELEKMKELAALTRTFGYRLKVGNDEVHPREIQKLIEAIEGTKEEAFLSRLTLRSMKRAKYSTVNEGHFGLATQYYCHFTSPIRRYPDLQIHRIIKENLRGSMSGKRIEHYDKILPGVAKQSSDRERIADDAEREVDKMKKAEYMADHIGECYEGVISGVTSWGIYVELPNTVEGMVRLSDMTEDDYKYQEEDYSVTGVYSGTRYQLGGRVTVQVVRVDRLTHTVDFAMVKEEG